MRALGRLVKAPPEIHECHRGRHAHAQQRQPDRGARAQQDAVSDLRGLPRSNESIYHVPAGHPQLVAGASLLLENNTLPSLLVIEQLSLLNRSMLVASTEPISDWEIGVRVSDHGM